MDTADAQREMREIYLNAAPGQAVSAAVWLASAACATWVSQRSAMLVLVIGGMFIFPLTQLILVALRRPASVRASNPLRELAPQVAFVVPLVMPLVYPITQYRASWFYPAFMVIVGAHYLPFAFLYGRRAFLALAAVLLAGGFALAYMPGAPFASGGWLTAAVLAGFAVISMPRATEERSPVRTAGATRSARART